MSSARYILAKHIPDVFRKEPKNIGIIVWSEFGVEARFWAVDAFGVVDKRQVPPFINSANAYQQWVTFWLSEIRKSRIEFIGSGKFADATSHEFMEAIQTGNSDSFFLQEAGVVIEQATKEELPAIANDLFDLLVTSEAIDEQDTATLVKAECEKIIKSTPLYGNKNFQKGKKVFPTIGPNHKIVTTEFSYSYGNGTLKWLGQNVPLKRYKSQLMKEVRSVCYNFERVFDNEFITPEHATTFIYPMDDQIGDKDVSEAIDLLGVYTKVVNLREPESAKREFEKVAAIELQPH